MSRNILAAMASIPRREHFLADALGSLRPYVDHLCIYLNGYDHVPDAVTRLCDDWVLSPTNEGASRKMWWASSHRGVYLSVDDDLGYPPDYVPTMIKHLDRWGGLAICSAHGRIYKPKAKDINDIEPGSRGIVHHKIRCGRWVNHGGTGVMIFDTNHVHMPSQWEYKNMVDLQVAVWAQQTKTPIWLVPHKAKWLRSWATTDPRGLFRTSLATGHRQRNQLLREQSRRGWRLWHVHHEHDNERS